MIHLKVTMSITAVGDTPFDTLQALRDQPLWNHVAQEMAQAVEEKLRDPEMRVSALRQTEARRAARGRRGR